MEGGCDTHRERQGQREAQDTTGQGGKARLQADNQGDAQQYLGMVASQAKCSLR